MRRLRSRGRRVGLSLACVLGIACSDDEGGSGTNSGGGAGAGGKAGSSGSAGSVAKGGGGGAVGAAGVGGGAGGSAGVGGSAGAVGSTGSGASGSAGVDGGGTSGASGSAGSGGSGQPDGGARCALKDSGPIQVTQNNQVIELVRIVSTSGAAINVNGRSGVVIRNVEIRHSGGIGINISGSNDVRIENVSIEHTGAPASGANSSDGRNNINITGSARPIITNVRLTRGSSGVYMVNSPDSRLSFLEGHDFRGPFPRGQLVQWDKSNNGLLEDFSVVNPPGSWPEDNVNIYQSSNVTVRRGFIDGNNSPSGVGVIFDGGPSTGLVEDVDAVHMGNGCFSDYDGGEGLIFRRTRCRDNICTSQDGRGMPLSGALMWSGREGHTMLRIEQSTYFAACDRNNIVWPRDSFAVIELEEREFTPRAPIRAAFCWE